MLFSFPLKHNINHTNRQRTVPLRPIPSPSEELVRLLWETPFGWGPIPVETAFSCVCSKKIQVRALSESLLSKRSVSMLPTLGGVLRAREPHQLNLEGGKE